MSTVITIILVIGALIFFHELGHLLLAKKAGMLCREFAIGFGPKVFSIKKGETLYSIRLLPMGGYVRVAGEDPEMVQIKTGHDVAVVLNEEQKVEKLIVNNKKQYPESILLNVQKIDLENELVIEGYDQEEELHRYSIDPQASLIHDQQEVQISPLDRQYKSKTVGQKAAFLFAGPFANFILAFVILFGFAMYNGAPTQEPMIGEVLPDTAAAEVGLQEGDVVLSVDGDPVDSWMELVQHITTHPNQELTFLIERQGEQMQASIVPDAIEDEMMEGEVRGFIGVAHPVERGFLHSVQYGFNQTLEFTMLIFQGIGMLISGGAGIDDLAGPVGIYDFTGQFAQAGLPSLLQWTAILSVNLAIFNLLPIPALDGGRLLFVGIEALRGRPIDPQKEGVVHFIGFALLMLLVLVVTWNDIQRLFQ